MQDITFRSIEPMTQTEFAGWVVDRSPLDRNRYELLDGFVVQEPPASWPHGEIAAKICSRLVMFVESARVGRVFDSSQGFDLPSGDTVEPDVSFVSAKRWRATRPVEGFPRVVPDLVFEVLSPSTAMIDRNEKKRIYAQNGVREYVLVDQREKSLQRFALRVNAYDDGRWFGGGQDYEDIVLPGFAFRVDDVFPEW